MSGQSTSTPIVYKEIPRFPGYRAGGDGSIWSCLRSSGQGGHQVITDRWRKLRGEPRKEDGRRRYTLRRFDGELVRAYGSHFVLETFVGPRPDGMEACHENGNCLDDAAKNLRWGTFQSNLDDKKKHGTQTRGEDINTAKLTVEDVLEIRRVGYPLKQHAIRLGVSETLISLILRRKVWTHV